MNVIFSLRVIIIEDFQTQICYGSGLLLAGQQL